MPMTLIERKAQVLTDVLNRASRIKNPINPQTFHAFHVQDHFFDGSVVESNTPRIFWVVTPEEETAEFNQSPHFHSNVHCIEYPNGEKYSIYSEREI